MFVAMRLVLALTLALLSCKENPPFYANAQTKVIDDRVELEFYGDADMTVTVPGMPPTPVATLPGPSPWKMSVPLDKFKDGDNTFEIKYESRGKVVTQTVSFVKPAGAGKAFVRLAECASSGTSGGHAKLEAGDLGKVDYCWAWSDGSIRIGWTGSLGGKLTVGDQTVEMGKDGKAQISYPLRPMIVRAPIRSALSDGAGITTQVPIVFARGSEKIEGKLSIDLSGAAKDITKMLFKDVSGGTPITGDAANRSKNSLVYLPADKYRPAVHFGKLTTVGEVGLVAVGHDIGTPREGSKCGPYSSSKGAPVGDGMAPRTLVDVQVRVFDATTGEKLGAQDFKADDSIDCPMFASSKGSTWEKIESRPVDKTVGVWLERVADDGKP
jgi:hypothetical protein